MNGPANAMTAAGAIIGTSRHPDPSASQSRTRFIALPPREVVAYPPPMETGPRVVARGEVAPPPRVGVRAPGLQGRRVASTPIGYFADFFFSSPSMIFLKASTGCAPTRRQPLMKKVGVPLAPTFVPAAASASTRAL